VSIVFVNGLVLDGLGGAIESGWVQVDGDRITGIGRAADLGRSGDGTRVIDLDGRTIMPYRDELPT
jgi:predicted amidohydrolase YtcJ